MELRQPRQTPSAEKERTLQGLKTLLDRLGLWESWGVPASGLS